jgi:RNA-directed DNA polymerase
MPTHPKLPTLRTWRTFLITRGLPPETIELYLGYIKPLVQANVPVIFDFEHLSKLLGRTLEFTGKATAKPSHFYRVFQIPKKSGDFRTISAPYESLKECQRWISDEILARVPIHPAAVGYVKDLSILDHASRHAKIGSALLIADLEQFFPSITKARVIGLFRSFGYNNQVSVALANLCCLDDCLPQGSPASPAISNLICRRLDGRLSGIAKKMNLGYSRYADDLCISGHQIPDTITTFLQRAVTDSGFSLNELKTRKVSMHSTNKVITGLNVNTGVPRLPKSTRRELQHAMHFIEKYGYLSHCSKLKIRDPGYIDKLRGRLEFWRFVEPENLDVVRYIAIVSKLQKMHRNQ